MVIRGITVSARVVWFYLISGRHRNSGPSAITLIGITEIITSQTLGQWIEPSINLTETHEGSVQRMKLTTWIDPTKPKRENYAVNQLQLSVLILLRNTQRRSGHGSFVIAFKRLRIGNGWKEWGMEGTLLGTLCSRSVWGGGAVDLCFHNSPLKLFSVLFNEYSV